MKNYKLIIPITEDTNIEIVYPSNDLIDADMLVEKWLKIPKIIKVKIEIIDKE